VTPSENTNAICGGCFLYERRGVCPAARDAYGLQNSAAAERRAEQFRQAVAQDARLVVSLAELVQAEAERPSAASLVGPAQPLLPAAGSMPTDPRKEAVHVFAARSTG
jgi:hypothetical protein